MIRMENISWKAAGFHLKDISFSVLSGRYAVLMGKTGCGKTSLLEVICGLRAPLTGKVWLGDRDVTATAPGARGLGYVPQDGALFPTMKVRAQLGFALRIRGESEVLIAPVVQTLARELNIEHLLDRKPQGLSGGERQRVALGRALAARPSVLLLDEPLAAVDEDTQGELIELLRRIQRDYAITVLHVTHSRHEAKALGQVRLRLEKGVVLQEPL